MITITDVLLKKHCLTWDYKYFIFNIMLNDLGIDILNTLLSDMIVTYDLNLSDLNVFK